jgi:hypothetical protein
VSLDQAVAHREWLLTNEAFSRSEEVVGRYGCEATFAEALKSNQLILGRCRGMDFFPAFQFAGPGPVHSAIARLIRHLPRENCDGGWAAIFWCFQPHMDLGGLSPAEAFATDPESVIAAAKSDEAGTSDTEW